jgi:hypothetical protein
LDAINIELIEECERSLNEGHKLTYDFISKQVLFGRGKPSALDILEKNLLDNIFYNNEGMARYALAKLDETSHSREYSPDLWARNEKGLFVWTIEHIFPQGKNIPKYWVEMVGDGDREETQRVYDDVVHCFGNLTLSGYNSRLSNQSFEKKQGKHEANIFGNRIYIGYKNGLALNNLKFDANGHHTTLAETDTWTRKHIESRNRIMVMMLLRLFKFDFEDVDERHKGEEAEQMRVEAETRTMAEYLDRLVAVGGTWQSLTKAARAEADRRGLKSQISKGSITAHINYRINNDRNWLIDRKLKVTDDGVIKGR